MQAAANPNRCEIDGFYAEKMIVLMIYIIKYHHIYKYSSIRCNYSKNIDNMAMNLSNI